MNWSVCMPLMAQYPQEWEGNGKYWILKVNMDEPQYPISIIKYCYKVNETERLNVNETMFNIVALGT